MRWFIKSNEGTYYTGTKENGETQWRLTRVGAVTFASEQAARDRMAEDGIEDAEPEEY